MRTLMIAGAFAALGGGAALAQDLFCTDCAVEKVAACGGFLEGLNVDAEGTVWAVDLFGNRILSIDPATGECTERGPGGGRPNGAKFAADGTLILADAEGLMRFDPADGSVVSMGVAYEGSPIPDLNDLVIAADGGIYFTAPTGSDFDTPIGRAFYVAPGSQDAELVADGMAFPNGIGLSPDGLRVYLAEFAKAQILVLPAQGAGGMGTSYIYARTTGGIGPDGMTVAPDGTLYQAVFQAGKVSVFSPRGEPLGDIVLPEGAGTMTTNVAVHDGVVYIVEGQLGEIWKMALPD
jgi:gluconolactonase